MLILGPSNETPIRTNVPLNGFRFSRGDVAQLGERLVRNEKVSGSIPLISTNFLFQAEKSCRIKKVFRVSAGSALFYFRRDGRAVEGARLESV